MLLRYIRSLLLLFSLCSLRLERPPKPQVSFTTTTTKIKRRSRSRVCRSPDLSLGKARTGERLGGVYSPCNKDGACARWRRRASGTRVFVRTERCNIAIVARERARVVPPVGAGLRCKQEWGGVFIVCRWRHKHRSVLMLPCFSSTTRISCFLKKIVIIMINNNNDDEFRDQRLRVSRDSTSNSSWRWIRSHSSDSANPLLGVKRGEHVETLRG